MCVCAYYIYVYIYIYIYIHKKHRMQECSKGEYEA